MNGGMKSEKQNGFGDPVHSGKPVFGFRGNADR